MITAIPTEYRGVRFRSMSEARFAAGLTKIALCDDWMYEPNFMKVDGWAPDFSIPSVYKHSEFAWHLIEYKPAEPTAVYLENLIEKCSKIHKQISCNLIVDCCWINWPTIKRRGADWDLGIFSFNGDRWERGEGRLPSVFARRSKFIVTMLREIATMRMDLKGE